MTRKKEQARHIRGSLYDAITDIDALYEGNLIKYFQIIFFNATNLQLPYHNFRHMMHVFWLCYMACAYYSDILTKREMRTLLIAALFHDFNHQGKNLSDKLNIRRAVAGVKKYILPEDRPYLGDIIELIQVTEYPYKASIKKLGILALIIRDADLSQALNPTWLQQVVFGLAAETNKKPIDILKGQSAFHKGFEFKTRWAKTLWPQKLINEKIKEAAQLLKLLEMKV